MVREPGITPGNRYVRLKACGPRLRERKRKAGNAGFAFPAVDYSAIGFYAIEFTSLVNRLVLTEDSVLRSNTPLENVD